MDEISRMSDEFSLLAPLPVSARAIALPIVLTGAGGFVVARATAAGMDMDALIATAVFMTDHLFRQLDAEPASRPRP